MGAPEEKSEDRQSQLYSSSLGSRMSVQNFMAIHPIVFNIYQVNIDHPWN